MYIISIFYIYIYFGDTQSENKIIAFVRPVKEDSPNRPEEQSTPSVETPRATEIDESRRRKLREIELKVAEHAQKLEAKGASNIAQQCDMYRAKLLEVRNI